MLQKIVKSWVTAITSVFTVYKWYCGTGYYTPTSLKTIVAILFWHQRFNMTDTDSLDNLVSDNPQLKRIYYLSLVNLHSTDMYI